MKVKAEKKLPVVPMTSPAMLCVTNRMDAVELCGSPAAVAGTNRKILLDYEDYPSSQISIEEALRMTSD